jgi:hypothetical protein
MCINYNGLGFGNGDVDDEEKAKGNTVASMGTTTGGRSVVEEADSQEDNYGEEARC